MALSSKKLMCFLLTGVFCLSAIAIGYAEFWRDSGESLSDDAAVVEAVRRKIPLSKVYASLEVDGFQHLWDVKKEWWQDEIDVREALEKEAFGKEGDQPKTFLVRGQNVVQAMARVRQGLFGGKPLDKPVSADGKVKGTNVWVFAYLGLSPSDPPMWVVEDVEQVGNTIRVSYVKYTDWPRTADVWTQYYLIPLGEIKPGRYVVELYFSSKKKVIAKSEILVK